MISLRATFCGLALLTALHVPATGAAQSMGVTAGVAGSDYRELDSPVSLGLHAAVPLVGWIHARSDYRRYSDRQTWTRSSCDGLVPLEEACPDDVFDGDFTLHAVGVGLFVAVPIQEKLGFEAGVQRSLTWADGVWRGRESGATVGRAPGERASGWSGAASVSYRVTRRITASVGVRLDAPEIRDCVADAYAGFCRRHDLTGLELGVALRL